MPSGKQLYGASEMLACRSTADYSSTGSTGINRFVAYAGTASAVDGIPNVTVNTVSGGDCLGILTDKPKAGETASVQTGGLAKIECGVVTGLTTVGAKVMSDTSGRAILATTGNFAMGEVYIAPAALGDIFTIRLYSGHPKQ